MGSDTTTSHMDGRTPCTRIGGETMAGWNRLGEVKKMGTGGRRMAEEIIAVNIIGH